MTLVPPQKNEAEQEAAWIVATVLDGVPCRRDNLASPSKTHDFDVTLPSGKVIALEVTSSVIAEVAAFWRDLNRRPIDTTGLQWHWSIQVSQPRVDVSTPRVKQLQKSLAAQLLILEPHLGGNVIDAMVDFVDPIDAVANAVQALRAMGVQVANPLPRRQTEPAQVAVGTGGFIRSTELTELVERAVHDNLEKLASAQADDRHLFLWITPSDLGNSAKLALQQLPDERPRIDCAVSVVWVALWSPNFNSEIQSMRLWSVSVAHGWQDHGSPLVRSYANRLINE